MSRVTQALKPVLLLQLTFGYDYGLFNSKSLFTKICIKIISAVVILTVSSFGLYLELFNQKLDSFFLYPIQYLFEALMITFLYGPRILQCLNSFNEIDEIIKINETYYKKLRNGSLFYIFLAFVAIMTYMIAITFQNNKLKITCLLLFILDISFILRIIFFHLIRYRIKMLRQIVEKHYCLIDLIKKEKKKIVDLNPVIHIQLYKSILERLDNYKECIELSFMFGLAISLMKLILLLYYISVARIKYEEIDVAVVVISVILSIHTAILLCLPGVYNELSASEVDKLKRILCNKLLENIDETEEKIVQQFLDYITHTPISYWAWRMIPVNNQMIISLAWFCATAMIIIMQFKN